LLSELEKKGHMQGIVKERGPGSNADLFFNTIAKHQDKDLAKAVLKLSKSFNIAKQDLDFILYTKQVYPEYLDFITKEF
jgi:hypothetical protein